MSSKPTTASASAPGRQPIGLPVLGTGSRAAAPAQWTQAPVVSFVSLGCAKNLVDSERMLGQLVESGCMISGDESGADTIVVNTCGFLESSRIEALEILRELAERKRSGGLRRIVVAGCLVQRDGESLRAAVPEIDVLVGVNNRDDIVRAVWRMDRDAGVDRYLGDYHAEDKVGWSDQGRLRLTPRHYAYVRISEGCNQRCTFCTIPSIRGPMHSKPPQAILAECRELVEDGAQELLLIGQDTTSYGADIGYAPGLAGLLHELDAHAAARWIRLMYVYPSVLNDAVIDALASCERVVKYIDMPLQHINDRVLKAMHRRVTRAQTEALLDRLRSRIPGLTVRTTFIVGFPGETEAEFQELERFVRQAGFEAAGAFLYSAEPGTPASRMKDQVADEVKAERYERLMLAQQEVAFERQRACEGRVFDVLIDDHDERGAVGRHSGQAPEVDSTCIFPDHEFTPGEFVSARCIGADDYDLVVEPVSRSRKAPRGKSAQLHRIAKSNGSR